MSFARRGVVLDGCVFFLRSRAAISSYIVKAEGVVFLRGFGSPKVHRQCPRNFPILSPKVLPTGLLVISIRKGNGEVLRVRKTGVRKMTTSVGR